MPPHTWSHLGDTVSDSTHNMYYRGQKIKEAYYRGEKIWGRDLVLIWKPSIADVDFETGWIFHLKPWSYIESSSTIVYAIPFEYRNSTGNFHVSISALSNDSDYFILDESVNDNYMFIPTFKHIHLIIPLSGKYSRASGFPHAVSDDFYLRYPGSNSDYISRGTSYLAYSHPNHPPDKRGSNTILAKMYLPVFIVEPDSGESIPKNDPRFMYVEREYLREMALKPSIPERY